MNYGVILKSGATVAIAGVRYTRTASLIAKYENYSNIQKVISKCNQSKLTDDVLKNLEELTETQLIKLNQDLVGVTNPLFLKFVAEPDVVKAWEKVFKEGNAVSDILRKDIPTLEWLAKHGDNIPQSAADDLLSAIDKPIKETLEDAQGRLTYVLDRPGQSNKVISVHPTSTGSFKTTTYSPSYNPDLNPNIPVPLSANKLTPDYISTSYMHPLQGDQIVKIKLSGNRNTDFARARTNLEITSAEETLNGVEHTWHHMDDFEIINGEAYGTMQLVQSSAHQGTGVLGMQHAGSAAQWRAYYGSGY